MNSIQSSVPYLLLFLESKDQFNCVYFPTPKDTHLWARRKKRLLTCASGGIPRSTPKGIKKASSHPTGTASRTEGKRKRKQKHQHSSTLGPAECAYMNTSHKFANKATAKGKQKPAQPSQPMNRRTTCSVVVGNNRREMEIIILSRTERVFRSSKRFPVMSHPTI